ncbi:hypothetical protein ECG_04588 [Echinococcus granulosus]|nr:hypothetical protein ECG_04590 [Echinococcus granulosus]KAH9282956.1 hypothetical protein ECG_04593 [Echinococcus granulosus]KAH9283798.1 hypothetical protein ECG_04588 [Echinococcus granulosus]
MPAGEENIRSQCHGRRLEMLAVMVEGGGLQECVMVIGEMGADATVVTAGAGQMEVAFGGGCAMSTAVAECEAKAHSKSARHGMLQSLFGHQTPQLRPWSRDPSVSQK